MSERSVDSFVVLCTSRRQRSAANILGMVAHGHRLGRAGARGGEAGRRHVRIDRRHRVHHARRLGVASQQCPVHLLEHGYFEANKSARSSQAPQSTRSLALPLIP